jgi:hypothetical protein
MARQFGYREGVLDVLANWAMKNAIERLTLVRLTTSVRFSSPC